MVNAMQAASAGLLLLGFYLAASVVTFIFYALDKAAARSHRARTPERTLHMLGLLGGWPGALLAQKLLRHKSGKLSFQAAFWFTVVLHCVLASWLVVFALVKFRP